MNIPTLTVKNALATGKYGLYEAIALMAILIAVFYLGKLSVLAQQGSKAGQIPLICQNEAITLKTTTVIASVNGSTYYAPWCGGVLRIKEENKRTFASPSHAARAGYRPARNCPSLL